MKPHIAFIALLAAMATASPASFSTTTIGSTTVAAVAPTDYPPICTFDPEKGEYICPVKPKDIAKLSENEANADTTTKDNAVVAAADCDKCQRDWDDCMKHWGCWFYDCNNPCKCQVVKYDPSCKDCSAGQCPAQELALS